MQVDVVNYLMLIALHVAKIGMKQNEIPVGALIVNMKTNKIISIAHNLVEATNNKINHAEIIAINRMFLHTKTKYLDDLAIIITFEPCLACLGCILGSGIKNIYYGLEDFKNGTLNGQNSKFISRQRDLNIYGGILSNYSYLLMKNFFSTLR